MNNICIITTQSSSIHNWIEPFLFEYENNNIHVTIVSKFDSCYKCELEKKYFIEVIDFPFPRGPSIFQSIKSINFLSRLFKKRKFDLVQYSTPNASLYGSLAAKKAKIKNRIYCQWGMVFISKRGVGRFFYKLIEKMICSNSTFVIPDSIGNLSYCRKKHFYNIEKSCVVLNGSAKGINLLKFDYSKKNIYKKYIFNKYKIDSNSFVIGFVGRLGRDKGCNELLAAFKLLKDKYKNLKLLFIGPIEKEKTIKPELLNYFFNNEDIIITNKVPDVEKYYGAMDIFVLPSYREGFGMSVIEASAFGVPVICTEFPGPSSAMVNNVTGFSIPIKNVDAIIEKVSVLINNKELREKFGKNGINFVKNNFEQKKFIAEFMRIRLEMLNK